MHPFKRTKTNYFSILTSINSRVLESGIPIEPPSSTYALTDKQEKRLALRCKLVSWSSAGNQTFLYCSVSEPILSSIRQTDVHINCLTVFLHNSIYSITQGTHRVKEIDLMLVWEELSLRR